MLFLFVLLVKKVVNVSTPKPPRTGEPSLHNRLFRRDKKTLSYHIKDSRLQDTILLSRPRDYQQKSVFRRSTCLFYDVWVPADLVSYGVHGNRGGRLQKQLPPCGLSGHPPPPLSARWAAKVALYSVTMQTLWKDRKGTCFSM